MGVYLNTFFTGSQEQEICLTATLELDAEFGLSSAS